MNSGNRSKRGRKAADEDGVEIIFKGPTGEGDTPGQIQIVESLLADNYDAICLAPLDATALRKPVDAALANNVPVVIFDSGLNDMKGVTSFVATNKGTPASAPANTSSNCLAAKAA